MSSSLARSPSHFVLGNCVERSNQKEAKDYTERNFPPILKKKKRNLLMDDLLTPQLLLHIPFVMEVLTTKDICLKRHEYIVVVTPWIADKEKDSFVWR